MSIIPHSLVSKKGCQILFIFVISCIIPDFVDCSTECPFTCKISQKCIHSDFVCDGEQDCGLYDNSDEENCEHKGQDDCTNGFLCAQSKICLSLAFVCDGEGDCGVDDHSDELNCSLAVTDPVVCNADEYACLDKRNCIVAKFVCDGVEDCLDGSDEVNCTMECTDYNCKSGECITKDFVCDGANDCSDGTDEENCPPWSRNILDKCKLELGKFLCKDNSRCLDIHRVCDNSFDCIDKSDENGMCHINECQSANCTKTCVNTPSGYVCTCDIGMEFVNGRCTDVNECELGGHCDQICENTVGSFICKCHEGYKLVNGICRAEDSEAVMVFSVGSSINMYFLSSKHFIKSVELEHSTSAVTYDGRNIYWAAFVEGQEAIYRSDEFGSSKEAFIVSGISLVEDLVIDWITKNIYFSDSERKHIAVCSHDGINCMPIFTNITNPRAIILYSTKGLMFHSVWGENAVIVKSGMDGSNVENIVEDNIKWPNGLALDMTTDRLFWADAHYSTIESVKLDGTDRKKLHNSKIERPFSLDVFEDRIYWSDWETNRIESCHKLDGKDHKTITRKSQRIYGIHIYHPILLKGHERNPCKYSGCSHLCLLSEHAPIKMNYTCACPINMFLSDDMLNCKYLNKPSQLIAFSNSALSVINYQTFGNFEITKTDQRISSLGGATYNPLSGEIIFSDLNDNTIYAYNPKIEQKTTIYSPQSKISIMDFDPIGNNLYWINDDLKSVEVLNMNSKLCIKVILDLGNDIPLDMALAPNDGFIFLALHHDNHIHVDRFTMDGNKESRVHVIENEMVGPRIALTYDHQLSKLFWADAGIGAIYSIEKDGTLKYKHTQTVASIYDIAILDEALFWLNIGSNKLHWLNYHHTISEKYITLENFVNETQIKIMKAGIPPQQFHECQSQNGKCSHICIPVQKRKICMCPENLELDSNGLDCIKIVKCETHEFKCSNGACLPPELKCNKRADCPNGEDEDDCQEKKIECTSSMFSCYNGKQCVESYQVCDDTIDCADESDEFGCKTFGVCSPGEFRCTSGDCIHAGLRCDNVKNCGDESDEENCKDFSCDSLVEFKCGSGTCIPKSWECDNEPNCEDGSDEHSSCIVNKKCPSTSFKCNNGRCIDTDLKCDGQDDCEDMSDEINCNKGKNSEQNLKQCTNDDFVCPSDKSICLPIESRCNGTAECPRNEDEESCENCRPNHFKCEKSGNCIPNEWVCDNSNDCGDFSDEQQCPETHTGFVSHKCDGFTCISTGDCIPWYQVCDNKTDCSDSSDEGDSCESSCINSKCSHECLKMPVGHRCSCSTGYRLDGDGRNCVDIDECSLNTCSQYCQNTIGSFSCSCKPQTYRLRSDKISCKALGNEMEYLFATNSEIRSRSKSSQNIQVVKFNIDGNDIKGFDSDIHSRIAYLTSETNGILIKLNLIDKSILKIKHLKKPTKVSYDWATENIYFVENGNTIHVCNFNIKSCALIYSTSKDKTISALRIDSKDRSLFWSEFQTVMIRNDKGTILMSDLACKDIKILVNNEIKRVGDIALDSINRYVYWSDSQGKKIETITYDGKNRRILYDNIAGEPLDLNIFEDNIYWLNGKSSTIEKYHLENTYITKCGLFGPIYKDCETIKLLPSNHKIQRFRLIQTALQSRVDNDCVYLRCTYMCVLGRSAPFCICSDGTFTKPGQNCTSPPTVQMFEEQFEGDFETADSRSSLYWILWVLFTLPLCGLLSWIIIFYVIPWFRRYPFENKHNQRVTFENRGFGYELSNGSDQTLTPGKHDYENPMIMEKPTVNILNTNEMKISRGKMDWAN